LWVIGSYSPGRYEFERIAMVGRAMPGLILTRLFRLSDGNGELSVGGGLRSGEMKDLGEVRMSVPKLDDPKPSVP
jgi:hypothetical protein